MGLFKFLKNAGAKAFTKKAVEEVKSPEIKKLEDELFRQQRIMLLKGVIGNTGIKVKNLTVDLNNDKVTLGGEVAKQEDKEKLILAVGNVSGIGSVDSGNISVKKPEPESTFHTVKKGDTLSKIAKKYYGDARKYMIIFEANTPMLKNPNRIYPGQQLRIPPMS